MYIHYLTGSSPMILYRFLYPFYVSINPAGVGRQDWPIALSSIATWKQSFEKRERKERGVAAHARDTQRVRLQ